MQRDNSKAPLDAVKTEAWRRRFLEKLSRIDGFDSHLARSHTQNSDTISVSRSLRAQAEQLIKSSSRHELARAKQYYNNALLVRFWRWFLQELERLSARGDVSREYPVFEVRAEREHLAYAVTSIPLQHFESLATDRRAGRFPNSDSRLAAPQAELDFLIGKLALLHKSVHQSFKTLYGYFLELNKQAGSAVWDYYAVFQFLDSFLYVAPDGQTCRAPFDRIFFNSSLHDLKLFLEYHLSRQLRLSPSDVDDFLKRQRTHYLKQAISVSLEESEALNHRKDLLRYDETRGVVIMDGFTDDIRRHYRERKIRPYRLVKLDGCPFAQSKGAKANALLEVYEYFDRLMLYVLTHSTEFDSLFGSEILRSPRHRGR